jgi:hypothetical protein
MPDPNLVRVNNTLYSWNSTRLTINGDPFTGGLVAVEHAQKRERKLVHGGSPNGTPKGWTSGKYSVPTLKMKFLKDSAAALKAELAVLGAGSYGDAEWLFTLACIEPILPPNLPIMLTGNPCVITDVHETREEGIEELVEEFDIMCLELLENGSPLWSVVRSI